MKPFRTPAQSIGDLDAETAGSLIAAAADVALVLDDDGVIRDLAFGSDELALEWSHKWLHQAWIATVTVESRPKIEALLRDANTKAPTRARHINHPAAHGPDVPIYYATIRIGSRGTVIAIGRDLRATAALQQRLVDTQQAMERNYARLRHVETRYRLLFQLTTEAVLIVDAATRRVLEANPAAGQILGEHLRELVGTSFPEGFDEEGSATVHALLATVRGTGRTETVRVRAAEDGREFLLSASLFRQEAGALFLIRLVPVPSGQPTAVLPRVKSRILEVVESGPDGFVVTDPEGHVQSANTAFLDLAQLPTEEQARGQSLERWLGRPGVDLEVLIANLRQHGSVRQFATTLRGEYGASTDIEVSAVSLLNGEDPCFGFTIRSIGRRAAPIAANGRSLPRSVEQLTELVGRVPLKDLVRETTDVIERLCIEAALELTGDNRASAAEILGLSRQSLYVKLRRYGLGDLAQDGEG